MKLPLTPVRLPQAKGWGIPVLGLGVILDVVRLRQTKERVPRLARGLSVRSDIDSFELLDEL
ncbi:hypothetical protein ACHFCA_26390 [Delftia tsuruhatensis]